MMNRIFSKILFGYILTIAILVIPVIYFSSVSISENYLQNMIENEIQISKTIELALKPYIISKQYLQLDSIAKSLNKQLDYRITVIDTTGLVVADSKANPSTMENHKDRPEVIKALASGVGTSIRHSYTVNKDMIYVALPVKLDNSLIGIIRLSIFIDDYNRLINDLENRIIKIVIIVTLIALLLALLLTRTFTTPIKELVRASRAVADGNFKVRPNIKTKDEFKILGDNFRFMIEQLETLFVKTVSQKDELNKIISSIQEGLVVMSKDGKITLSNNSFTKLTNYKSVIGKFYWEVFRDNQINKAIRNMLDTTLNISEEIEFNNEYYICSANHINDENELVLILYNISELKKLENIKKDFVTNVSHELRTPLTVIKGYIETIEDSIDESNSKYIGIIKNHTNRLINIVQDLLTISQLEEKNTVLEISEIKISSFVQNIKNTFEQKLLSKNLTMDIEVADGLESFKADEFKIEQLFINLIDNAIKYSERGFIKIRIYSDANNICLEFIDSGIGIPQKDQERIFERFYTVDKSRSRQVAGTGLGLSIVKHIVLLHKGKISVDSSNESGTKFNIVLPVLNNEK